MKRLEELIYGDAFELEGKNYILTPDFKSGGKKMCIDLKSGSVTWIKQEEFVNHKPIYILDEDNNIVALRPMEKIDA